METGYPVGPRAVPTDLTKATKKYRRHAWLAVLGLVPFVTVYFAFAVWFTWGAYLIISQTIHGLHEPLLGYLIGGCSAFLGLFMIKALFFVKHSGENSDMEMPAETQPKLFNFLYRLAVESGAPRHTRYFSRCESMPVCFAIYRF